MKNNFLILLFLFPLLCFSQTSGSLLLVPFKASSIEMGGRFLKVLKENKVQPDSVKQYILISTLSKLQASYPNYKFLNPETNGWYKSLRDSTRISWQWNTVQTKKIADSQGFGKIVNSNDDSEKNKYYGRVLDNQMEVLKMLMNQNDCRYALFLNKFEIKRKRMFSQQASFILHVDVYDKNSNKVYGNTLIWEHSIPKGLSYSMVPFMIRNALDDFYAQLKKHIN
jgi:hypothetical protein